jgi:urocanate hydratase
MIEIYPDGDHRLRTAGDVNQGAYLLLKTEIDSQYPKDWFVGIAEGRVAADAESFETLQAKLNELGFASPDVLVVQAGEDSDFLWIL